MLFAHRVNRLDTSKFDTGIYYIRTAKDVFDVGTKRVGVKKQKIKRPND